MSKSKIIKKHVYTNKKWIKIYKKYLGKKLMAAIFFRKASGFFSSIFSLAISESLPFVTGIPVENHGSLELFIEAERWISLQK